MYDECIRNHRYIKTRYEKIQHVAPAKFLWVCPICDKTARKKDSHYKSRRCGKKHIENLHDIYDLEPKVIKTKYENLIER